MFRAKLLRVKFGRNSARRQIVIFLKLRMANIWRGARENRIDFPRSERSRVCREPVDDPSNAPGLPGFRRFLPFFISRIHVEEDFYGLNLKLLKRISAPIFFRWIAFFFFLFVSFLFLPRNEAFIILRLRDVRIREILKARLVLIRITWGVFKLFE